MKETYKFTDRIRVTVESYPDAGIHPVHLVDDCYIALKKGSTDDVLLYLCDSEGVSLMNTIILSVGMEGIELFRGIDPDKCPIPLSASRKVVLL